MRFRKCTNYNETWAIRQPGERERELKLLTKEDYGNPITRIELAVSHLTEIWIW
jgi:hypothetical protein